MMALAGVELETLVSEPDALTTRPPPCLLTDVNIKRKVTDNKTTPGFNCMMKKLHINYNYRGCIKAVALMILFVICWYFRHENFVEL